MAYDLGDFILISEEGVAVIPGSLFGQGGFGQGPFGGTQTIVLTGIESVWEDIETP